MVTISIGGKDDALKTLGSKFYRRIKLTESIYVEGHARVQTAGGYVEGKDVYIQFDPLGYPFIVPKNQHEVTFVETTPAEVAVHRAKIAAIKGQQSALEALDDAKKLHAGVEKQNNELKIKLAEAEAEKEAIDE